MEPYINNKWTECYGNSYIAEAIAWSENGNHTTIFTTGATAEEADAKLVGAMRELKLVSETSVEDGRNRKATVFEVKRLGHEKTSRGCDSRGSR